ncbi:hypothetical protein K439DRAFT_1647685 [Ramaria rubella]|nr:hypothetical protein K439DRAFT_1647685 [Ramaria rubella]
MAPTHQSLSNTGRKYWCGFCELYIRTHGFHRHAQACKQSEDSIGSESAGSHDEPLLRQTCPAASMTYIEIEHHPHSGLETEFIFHDLPSQSMGLHPSGHSITNFEFAETAVQSAIGAKPIKKLIKGIKHEWTDPGHSKLSFQNLEDYNQSLNSARSYVVQFQEGHVQATYAGQEFTYKFLYRDPWKWILSLLTDPTLSSELIFYSVKKTLHENGQSTHLYDEVNSGKTWWDIQVTNCLMILIFHIVFLPLHLWMDNVLHPAFLRHEIQNGSGNGGGVLLGYMPRVIDPSDPDDRKASETVEFGCFKREVYHKLLCGDACTRVFFPGIPIESLDGEEAVCTCRACGASAEHPCPHCLVSHARLHELTKQFTFRTVETMFAVYQKALKARTKKDMESILKEHGLHLVMNAFWFIANSDSHLECSYDLLHADDIGKWGKHLWPLLLEILGTLKKKGELSIKSITTLDFSDGQGYFDILKCILPCIVQLHPADSPMIHCIRAYACFCIFAGFHVITEQQIERMKGHLKTYEYSCSEIHAMYGKDFNFPKQHAPAHLEYDITHKGATINYNAHVGEGVQQEVQQAYVQTNGKKVEGQMTHIDENQEAIACIRMAVDAYDADSSEPQGHWKLGAPEKHKTSKEIETDKKGNPTFQNFHKNLVAFLREICPSEKIDGIALKIIQYKCVYLRYQSQETWQSLQDIPATYACLHFVFRCFLNSGAEDIALISLFKDSRWSPKTQWDGCRIFEEKEYTFMQVKYLAWACHMVPIVDKKVERHCLNDLIDSDMFPCCGN